MPFLNYQNSLAMNVLVTGGSGFIGSHICDTLLSLNFMVVSIDNYSTGKKVNNASHKNYVSIDADICDDISLEKAFVTYKPQIVIHAAASYANPNNWIKDIDTNIKGTVNIINLSEKYKITKFIYLQTSLSYGLNPLQLPILEDHALLSGGSSYAISKTAAEHYLQLSSLNYISFRLANVYGPRNLSGPIPTFFLRLTNNQTCTIINTKRDFIYVADVVNAIIKGIELQNTKQRQYNIATGKDVSIKTIFNLISDVLELPKPVIVIEKEMESDDTATILLNPKNTVKDLDWNCKTTLNDGLIETLNWYKNNTIDKVYTHLKNIDS